MNKERKRIVEQMKDMDPLDPEYDKLLLILERFDKAERGQQDVKKEVIKVVGNVLGIILILNFEQLGVITSRAMSLIRK